MVLEDSVCVCVCFSAVHAIKLGFRSRNCLIVVEALFDACTPGLMFS